MNWIIRQAIDLKKGYPDVVVWPNALMLTGDKNAHTWEVEVFDSGVPVDLTGSIVNGYFIRDDGQTVYVAGSATGNKASVKMNVNCYAIQGSLRGVLRIVKAGETMTACEVFFTVKPDAIVGTIIDPGHVIPTLDELLAQIAAMETLNNNVSTAEAARVVAENGRVSAENARKTAETTRESNEAARKTAETGRVSAESARASAETARSSAETTRQSNETARNTAEAGRVAAEIDRVNAELARQTTSTAATNAANEAASAANTAAENANIAAGKAAFTLKGLFGTLGDLLVAHPTGNEGDAYAIGTEENNEIYIWDVDTGEWVNIGKLHGPHTHGYGSIIGLIEYLKNMTIDGGPFVGSYIDLLPEDPESPFTDSNLEEHAMNQLAHQNILIDGNI